MKNISILGATGSIGTSTLKVVDSLPCEFNIIGLTANRNVDLLIEQSQKYNPKIVALADDSQYLHVKKSISGDIKVVCGNDGLVEVATHSDNALLVSAIVGVAGLIPTYEAINSGIDIAIANKEVLVVAGKVITDLANKKNVKLLPVDSEHNALYQCLMGQKNSWIEKLILTASGGPFLNTDKDDFSKITIKQALAHPKWSMGKKISIDSATMMNKGLEVIEAHWLFSVPYDSIDIVVHPESIIHSMVEFIDGSCLAQMNVPDMTIPIQNVLTYPERKNSGSHERLDLFKLKQLNFVEPDIDKFPCLRLAYEAARHGHSMPAVLNGANEQVVNMFINGKVKFVDIPNIIEKVISKHQLIENPDIGLLKQVDIWSREEVNKLISIV